MKSGIEYFTIGDWGLFLAKRLIMTVVQFEV